MSNIANLKDLRCPECGSDDILPIGKKGAAGGEIAAAFFWRRNSESRRKQQRVKTERERR